MRGLKAFATDDGVPVIAHGAPPGAAYFFFGDEQGGVIYSEEAGKLGRGAALACVVPHCDPTVNLYDRYHAVRGDTLEAIWPVDARGKIRLSGEIRSDSPKKPNISAAEWHQKYDETVHVGFSRARR